MPLAEAGSVEQGTDRERQRVPSLTRARMWVLLVACFAVALASLSLPFAPSPDPWAWLVWGRELVALDLNTDTGGSMMVSWKPLPVLITAVLSPFGDLAPELWLVVARTGSLLALALAYRLGARLAGTAGGVVAALALLLTPGWIGWSATGFSEPLLAALLLWAVERHLDGHRGQAFFLGFLVALGRPEAALLLALYGLLAWRSEPRKLLGVAAAGAALILLWFGVDWLASGSPATGSARAGEAEGSVQLEDHPLGLLLAPVWLLAVTGLVVAARDAVAAHASRRGQRLPQREARMTLVLAAGALAWVATVVAMGLFGYPPLVRFMVPAGAVLCVVAGVAAGWLLRVIAASRVGPPVLAGALLVALPFAITRVAELPQRAVDMSEQAATVEAVHGAVDAAGGPDRVLACGRVGSAAVGTQGALAWKLGVQLNEVEGVTADDPRGPLDVAVVVARDRAGALEVLPSGAASEAPTRLHLLGGSDGWSVFAIRCPSEAAGAEAGRA